MTTPLYDPFARFEDAKIGNAADRANHVADYYRTAFVELLNNVIIDCEANGLETVPVKALRIIATYAATLPPPIVVDKGETH